MTKDELLKIYNSIEWKRDIIGKKIRGSEENVKIKIILPLLEFLGFNIYHDLDFELGRADIVLLDERECPLFVIETKSWNEQITKIKYLEQCWNNGKWFKCPYFMITSGRETAIYSILCNTSDMAHSHPLVTFTFSQLQKNDNNLLENLNQLVGKFFLKESVVLERATIVKLPYGKSIEEARGEFREACHKYRHEPETRKLSYQYSERIAIENRVPYVEFLSNQFQLLKNKYRDKIILELSGKSTRLKPKIPKLPVQECRGGLTEFNVESGMIYVMKTDNLAVYISSEYKLIKDLRTYNGSFKDKIKEYLQQYINTIEQVLEKMK